MNKKGISPIIASVFLIVFTVTIATLALNWFSGYTSDITSSADTTKTSLLNCSKIAVRIKAVYINTSVDLVDTETNTGVNESIRITVSNEGQNTLSLKDVAVYDNVGNYVTLTPTATNLDPGIITTASNTSSTLTLDADCGDFAYAMVTTTCSGVSYKYTGTPTCVKNY